MVNGINYEEYIQLAVRITKCEQKILLGSGLLFVRGSQEDAVVLTAAHVTNEQSDPMELHLLTKDGIVRELKISGLWEDERYVHDPKGEDKEYDAALFRVEWEEWMKDLPFIRIGTAKQGYDTIGYGYPASGMTEGINGRSELPGHISDTNPGQWWVSMTYEKNLTKQAARKSIMEGFSGSGIFQKDEYTLTYIGAVSGGMGDETFGKVAKLTRGEVFLELLEKQDLLPKKTEDLTDYVYKNLENIEAFNEDSRRYFEAAMLSFVEDQHVTPEQFLIEGKDRFHDLPCKSDRTRCPHYWNGQLTHAVCFCDLWEEGNHDLKETTITMDNGETVNVALFCTEMKAETCIREMLEQGYFSKEGGVKNNTILLWANENQHAIYSQMRKKKHNRKIVADITSYRELASSFSGTNGYHIVRGKKFEDFNIGILGIGILNANVLANCDGDVDDMKDELTRLVETVWK